MNKKLFLQLLVSCLIILSTSYSIAKSISATDALVQPYNISFGDSGVGGLIFATDAYKDIATYLQDIEAQYYVKFQFHHVGDSENAPYGIKPPEQIKFRSNNFIHYMVAAFKPKVAIVACNTASTIFSESYTDYVNSKFKNTAIIPIIKESAVELYNKTKVEYNPVTKKHEMHMAILATKATIKSGVYQRALKKIHAKQQARKEVVMRIYTYSPESWVESIEAGAPDAVHQKNVALSLRKMSKLYPNLAKITSIGLFCTHFPFLSDKIRLFLKSLKIDKSPVL